MSGLRQESDLLPGTKVIGVLIGLIVVVALGVAAAYWLGERPTGRGPGAAMRPERIPREVNAMETSLFEKEAQGLDQHDVADAHLRSYGWVEREHDLIHIPIARAFEVYLERRAQETP